MTTQDGHLWSIAFSLRARFSRFECGPRCEPRNLLTRLGGKTVSWCASGICRPILLASPFYASSAVRLRALGPKVLLSIHVCGYAFMRTHARQLRRGNVA